MPKTNFSPGTIVTSAFLNAINNIVFRENPDNDGEIPLIEDADLSNAAGNIKPQWAAFRDSLLVSENTGLAVSIAAGAALLPNRTIQTISPQTLVLPDNTTVFVYIGRDGSIVSGSSVPTTCLVLAEVSTSLGAVASITDMRPRFIVAPRQESVKVLGGGGDEGALTITADTTLSQGEYYLSSLTISAGVTVTVPAMARFFVSGNVQIDGTINVTAASPGGTAFPTSTQGTVGNFSGIGPGTLGDVYNYALSNVGSGGRSGFVGNFPSSTSTLASGGAGGGGLIIESGGNITLNGTIRTNGANGGVGSVQGGSPQVSGGGGGSGGLQLYKAIGIITASPSAVLESNGGNGGNAVSGDAFGGGGGGGGMVVFLAPNINVGSAAINVSPGSVGVPLGNQTIGVALGGGGGAGFGGIGGGGTSLGPLAEIGVVIQRQFAPVA